jgi:DnaK suppressor protein
MVAVMSPDDQHAYITAIRARDFQIRQSLNVETSTCDAVSPDVAIGRLSRLDAMQMQQVAPANRRQLETELTALDAALVRIATGRYGSFQMCGKAIPAERLHHEPAAVCCVPCLESVRRK